MLRASFLDPVWLSWVCTPKKENEQRTRGSFVSRTCVCQWNLLITTFKRTSVGQACSWVTLIHARSIFEKTRNGPGQFLGSYVINRVLTTHLVQWLSWFFATQERKKDRQKTCWGWFTTMKISLRSRNYGKAERNRRGQKGNNGDEATQCFRSHCLTSVSSWKLSKEYEHNPTILLTAPWQHAAFPIAKRSVWDTIHSWPFLCTVFLNFTKSLTEIAVGRRRGGL